MNETDRDPQRISSAGEALSHDYRSLESGFPAMFSAAESASAVGQRTFKLSSALSLALFVVAAICGAIDSESAGWIAASAFAAGVILMALALVSNAEVAWYDGRAVAESIKTTSWKFSVGGAPFELSNQYAIENWHDTIRSLSIELESLQSPLDLVFSDEPDELLIRLRNESYEIRRSVYLTHRLKQQREWYAQRAAGHRRSTKVFELLAIGSQIIGIALAILKATGTLHIDLLSIAATVASGMYAWLGVGDSKVVARSYEVAANELDLAVRESAAVGAADWAMFVADAESAMSREHTMWLTRRRANSMSKV